MIKYLKSLFITEKPTQQMISGLIKQNPECRGTLISEVQGCQFFYLETDLEHLLRKPYKKVYWREKNSSECTGPFSSLKKAMANSYWHIAELQSLNKEKKLIRIDFKTRKRLL